MHRVWFQHLKETFMVLVCYLVRWKVLLVHVCFCLCMYLNNHLDEECATTSVFWVFFLEEIEFE